MYDDLQGDDVEQLFADSIILYENKPVYVTEVIGKTLKCTPLKRGAASFQIPCYDLNIKTKGLRLGFLNFFKNDVPGCVFFERKPIRQYKLGLCRNNVKLSANITGMGLPPHIWPGAQGEELEKTILGNYPTLQEALTILEKYKKGSRAFSRYFCIDANYTLYYRSREIGLVMEDNAKPIVKKEFRDINPFLEQVTNAKA